MLSLMQCFDVILGISDLCLRCFIEFISTYIRKSTWGLFGLNCRNNAGGYSSQARTKSNSDVTSMG